MYSFNNILKKSERCLSRQKNFSANDAQTLYRMIQQYYKENPDASDREVNEYFSLLFGEINDDIMKIPTIKSNMIRYNTCKYLNRNPDKLKEAYEKIEREEKEGKRIYVEPYAAYNSSVPRATRQLTLQVLNTLRAKQAQCERDEVKTIIKFFRLSKSEQNSYKRKLSSEERRKLEELRTFFEGDEFTQFSRMMKKNEEEFARQVKNDCIYSITFVGGLLSKLGLLKEYNTVYATTLKRLGLEGLEYPTKEEEKDTISVESLFSEGKLAKLDLSQLIALSAFWINRFTKEIDNLNRTFFMINQLGLLDKIRDTKPDEETGYIDIRIDRQELENLYKKMSFLQQLSDEALDRMNNSNNDDKMHMGKVTRVENRTVVQVDLDSVLEEMEQEIGNAYETYFGTIDGAQEQSFYEDIENYIIMENAKYNTYRLKDMNMIAMLSNFYQGITSDNWGIILGENTSSKNSKKILLGADIEGLNMPLRLHIDRSLVQDFIEANQNTSLIPIYEGAEDFVVGGRYVGTQVLMPFCEKQRKTLEQESGKNPRTRNFLEHIGFLADSSHYPEHLKKEVVARKKGRSKIVKKRPPKIFMDINTGEQYQRLDEKNNDRGDK